MLIIKPINKFKTFKSDAAPFFFYLDIFPPNPTAFKSQKTKALLESIKLNPVMPLPMRVDRVFNGEKSVLIRPREPISFLFMDNLVATINPSRLLQHGIEKLIYFTEIRGFENFFTSLTIERAKKWWDSSRFLYAKLLHLEEDFSAFLKAYIQTLVKTKINDEDLIIAAKDYCQMISEICDKRIKENTILIETMQKEDNVKLYKEKRVTYKEKGKKVKKVHIYPELVDIDVFDLSKEGFFSTIEVSKSFLEEVKIKKKKYIPLLFYDDLLECMLYNLKKIEESDDNILDPSFLLDQKVIILHESKELKKINPSNFSWFNSFEKINLELFIQSIREVKQKFFSSSKNIGN